MKKETAISGSDVMPASFLVNGTWHLTMESPHFKRLERDMERLECWDRSTCCLLKGLALQRQSSIVDTTDSAFSQAVAWLAIGVSI